MLGATVDLRSVTREDFDAYRVGSYRSAQPLGCRHAPNGGGGVQCQVNYHMARVGWGKHTCS